MRERAIIHFNVADFAVAIERVVDSRLRERPVIIAPEGALRATVYDMSEEAYGQGVRKGMPIRRALRFCKDARLLAPHPDRYERAMRAFMKRVLPYSPLIELAGGDGHLFVDATGTSRMHGPPPDVAWRIRRSARAELGFDPIWSLAPNKLVAKVASRLVKPCGEYIVEPGDEAALLEPLPVSLVPGIEQLDLLRLREFNLTRVSQVVRLSYEQLKIPFGRRARLLYESVRGVDFSIVPPVGSKPPTVIREHEFGDDCNDRKRIESILYRLAERSGGALRKRRMCARRLLVQLTYSDGFRSLGQCRLTEATANDFQLFAEAQEILKRAWRRRVRIRHLRLICDRLVFPPAQLDLFDSIDGPRPRERRLVEALDHIRGRFGEQSIHLGRSMAES